MQVVYEAENLIDAHLVRGRLEGEGIDAFVRGEHLTGAMGELPVGGLLAVCVAEHDLEQARSLLADWAAEAAAAEPDDQSETDSDPETGSGLARSTLFRA
jgi:hypothetical protein